jgi:hypothetical protein
VVICEPDQTCFARFPRSSSDSRLARARSSSLAILIQVSLVCPSRHRKAFACLAPAPSSAVCRPRNRYSAFQYACDLRFPSFSKKEPRRQAGQGFANRPIPSLAVLSTSYRPSYGTGHTHSLLFLFLLAAYFPLITPARPSLIISLQITSSLVLSLPIIIMQR